jgi:hypothetical protein
MAVIAHIAVVLLFGFALGFLQSLATGIYAGSWSVGTGVLWGIIIAVPSGIAAIWLGWYSLLIVAVVAGFVLALSVMSIFRDRRKVSGT